MERTGLEPVTCCLQTRRTRDASSFLTSRNRISSGSARVTIAPLVHVFHGGHQQGTKWPPIRHRLDQRLGVSGARSRGDGDPPHTRGVDPKHSIPLKGCCVTREDWSGTRRVRQRKPAPTRGRGGLMCCVRWCRSRPRSVEQSQATRCRRDRMPAAPIARAARPPSPGTALLPAAWFCPAMMPSPITLL